jgi:hypothetical protein
MNFQNYLQKIKNFASHPTMKEVIKSLKPTTSYWSLVGIIFFFFVPEGISYFYGDQIAEYANSQIRIGMPTMEEYSYKTLATLGEVSVFNLMFGVGLVVAFFILRTNEKKKRM